jgi:hypothetical protein
VSVNGGMTDGLMNCMLNSDFHTLNIDCAHAGRAKISSAGMDGREGL